MDTRKHPGSCVMNHSRTRQSYLCSRITMYFACSTGQGVSLEDLEIGVAELKNPRRVWRIFAEHYFLFRGTPTRIWLDFAFHELFGMEKRLSADTADLYFDAISEKLRTPAFLPRALYERFHLEVLATTDSPLDSLSDHQAVPRLWLESSHYSDLPPRSSCRSRIHRIP